MKPNHRSAEGAQDIRIYGLTGGIASGKSLAARFFADAGALVVDADRIARELTAPGGAAENTVLQRFGTTDRAALRKIVFSDPRARKDLESILHPLIQIESEKRFKKLIHDSTSPPPFLVYEAALLVESGRHRDFDGLIVVTAPEELRLKRLMVRDSLSREMAEKIFSAQAPESEKISEADYVIVNDGTPEELRERVNLLADRLYKAGTAS